MNIFQVSGCILLPFESMFSTLVIQAIVGKVEYQMILFVFYVYISNILPRMSVEVMNI